MVVRHGYRSSPPLPHILEEGELAVVAATAAVTLVAMGRELSHSALKVDVAVAAVAVVVVAAAAVAAAGVVVAKGILSLAAAVEE
jgi:hypothetical protein